MSKSVIQQLALEFVEKRDNRTLTALTNRIKPGLTSFVRKYMKDEDSTKDVVNKTFVRIWEKVDQYNPQFHFSTWTYTIAKREAIGVLREREKMRSREDIVPVTSCDQLYDISFDVASDKDIFQELYNLTLKEISLLREPYRRVMFEREVNGKKLGQIAEDFGWNLNTVKTRVKKAREDIAASLCSKHPELVNQYHEEEKA